MADAAAFAPALRFTRANLVGEIKGDCRESDRRRRWHARDALVVCQMAVTIVLLVCAGLLIRSIGASERANVGFRTDGLAIVSGDSCSLSTPSMLYASEIGPSRIGKYKTSPPLFFARSSSLYGESAPAKLVT